MYGDNRSQHCRKQALESVLLDVERSLLQDKIDAVSAQQTAAAQGGLQCYLLSVTSSCCCRICFVRIDCIAQLSSNIHVLEW